MNVHIRLIAILISTFILLPFAGCSSDRSGESASIDALAEQIVPGQTYAEVCSLLGREGVDVGSGAIIYEWALEGDQKLLVWFSKPDGESCLPDDLIVTECRIEDNK